MICAKIFCTEPPDPYMVKGKIRWYCLGHAVDAEVVRLLDDWNRPVTAEELEMADFETTDLSDFEENPE